MAMLRQHCLGAFVVLTLASLARGDGCYIPERAVRKLPAIPAQRALLSWKDGRETLLISSALDSDAQKLGWIIPLPSPPDSVKKALPGSLKTLDFCLQPKITHDLQPLLGAVIYVFVVANIVLATLLFRKDRLALLLLEFLIFGVLPALTLPALGDGRASSTKAGNVQLGKTATVGSYEVSILTPNKPEVLNAWLAKRGFSVLPEAARPIVADYISKGWVFAAIRLTRAESGENAPHPVEMSFASKEPIYPLRLTGLAGGGTAFEIFVIANDRAVCRELQVEFCDRFRRDTDHTSYVYDPESDPHYETKTFFVGKTTKQRIGHPAICSLMWDKCILTKFAGTIDAGGMTADLHFDRKPFEAHQQHFYTRRGAYHFALILFACLTGCWLAVSMVACRRTMVVDWGLTRYVGKVLLPVVALYAVGAAILFACLPKLAGSEVVTGRHLGSDYFSVEIYAGVKGAMRGCPQILQLPQNKIAELLLMHCASRRDEHKLRNPITGADVLLEDSPGNFTVEKSDKGVSVRVYDHIGRPMLIEQPFRDAEEQGRGVQGGEDPGVSEPQ
jgi:hypothetical protein